MSVPGLNSLEDIMVGNDAGWLLSFSNATAQTVPGASAVLEIGRDDYYADIKATMPSGMAGGEYQFVIEGMTDEHYASISRANTNACAAAYLDLYLYWRDTASSVVGYLKNLAGLTDTLGNVTSSQLSEFLVAKLYVISVTRKTGTKHYETTIVAKERVYELARRALVCGQYNDDQPLQNARQVAESAGITCQTHDVTATSGSDTNTTTARRSTPEIGRSTLDTLNHYAGRLEKMSNKYGRGMLLIRDGQLHIGARNIPLAGSPKVLHAGVGLIEIEVLAPVTTDPNFNPCDQMGPPAPCSDELVSPPQRKQYKLTLKGRSDIKPGDVVEFMPPSADVAATHGHWTGALGEMVIGAVAGDLLPNFGQTTLGEGKVSLYVASVAHNIGRRAGFSTVVTGVQLASMEASSAWDSHSPASQTNRQGDRGADASATQRIAEAQARRVRQEFESRSFTDVAEVRGTNISGNAEPPAQTLTLWRGLDGDDGGNNQSRRLPIKRPSNAPAQGVSYASPFAWGKTGLVLPRYPGTRVVVSHRRTERGDPIDIGALWESGQAPDSQAGDWWLILPVDVEEGKRQSIGDDEVITGHTGKATNDLIDVEGNRVLEYGSFTLRFGKSQLANAGTRPAAAEADSVTIEHAEGKSSIVMKADGSIELKGANITLDAGSGEIKLKASAVKVE